MIGRRTALGVMLAMVLGGIGNAAPEELIQVTPVTLSALAAFQREPKFAPTEDYTGFQPASERLSAEADLNGLVARLIEGLPTTPTKSFVLSQFAALLPKFEDDDTEDRERLCMYLKRIKEIVGIKSLDGLLNRWLYGFDPTGGKGD